jgi:hypothetical protein
MDRPGLHSGPSLERIPLPVVLVDTTKVPGHLLYFIFIYFFIFPNPNVCGHPYTCARKQEGFLFIRKLNGDWKKYWFVRSTPHPPFYYLL